MPSGILHNSNIETLPWFNEPEGQLGVDVIELDRELIVRTVVAGVKSDDLEVTVTPDTITIRGERRAQESIWERQGTIHVQECHWGRFSRSIVLPCAVRPDEADAVLKDGVLTITVRKAQTGNRLTIIDETEL